VRIIEILVVVGGLVAMLGSALLEPGLGQLTLGMVGLVLVLAGLAVFRRGWSHSRTMPSRDRFAEGPPSAPEDDRPASPEHDAPPTGTDPDRRS